MIADIGQKRFKTLPDVFFARSSDGVWLRNSAGSFYLKGAQAYEMVRALLAQLDGVRTIEEICAGLSPERRQGLERRLLEPLLHKGFLVEVHHPLEPVPSWVEENFAEQIAFLERYFEQPVRHFLDLRQKQIVCVGDGLLLRALTASLADIGFGRVTVLAADTGDDLALLNAAVTSASRLGEDAHLQLRALAPAVSSRQALNEAMESSPAAVLIGFTSRDAENVAEALRDLSPAHNGPAITVVASSGRFLLASPLLLDPDWCFECLSWSVADEAPIAPAPPSAALAAFQATRHVFCRLAGSPVPEDHRFTTVACRSLDVQVHTPRPHPCCTLHGHRSARPVTRLPFPEQDETVVRPDIPTSRDAEEATRAQNTIIETVAKWTDRVVGPFISVDEGNLEQLPLSASRCVLKGLHPSETQAFECRAIAAREARNQVVLWALEWLAGEIARNRNEWQGACFGAGWSIGEAIYRASAAFALKPAANDSPANRIELEQRLISPAGTFLYKELKDRACGNVEVMVNETSSGLMRACVRNNDQVLGQGVGIDERHAVEHGLADAVAGINRSESGRFRFTAHLSPSAARWTEILRWMGPKIGGRCVITDMGSWLPFVQGSVRIVALTPNSTQAANVFP